MMLFWIIILVALVALAWSVFQRGRFPTAGPEANRAETILRERFARGEIDEASYRRMLDELRR